MLSQNAYFGMKLPIHIAKKNLVRAAHAQRASHAGEHASRAEPHRTATGPGGAVKMRRGNYAAIMWCVKCAGHITNC